MPFFHKKYLSLFVLSLVLLFSGCDDFESVDIESQSNDQVDFSTYVAIGNSLTAGFQSNALYRNAQVYSFPNLLAEQMHVVENFEQPLISEPGIGARVQLDDNLNPTSTGDGSGVPLNNDLNRPFNNLAIPGSILADFTGTDLPGAPYSARQTANPFFNVVLRDLGNTQAEQVAALEPTFITFFLGNNDVLGFVTSGGEGQPITPPSSFNQLYQASAQVLQSTGANVSVYNIPDVTSIPFVFVLRAQLQQQGAIVFNETTQSYQLVTPQGNFDIFINVDGTPQVMRQDDFLLLPAQSYFAQVQAGNAPPPIQPQNAIPDNLVLDGNLATPTVDSELEQAAGAVAQFNASIQDIASASGFTLVDINSFFNEIISNGSITSDGITLTPVPGSLFSFDGVHPSNRGYAILANESIRVINDSYGTSLQRIDVGTIPQGLPVTAN